MYWDNPTTPIFVFKQAVTQLQLWQGGPRGYDLYKARVVQRFVTVVYLGGSPVRTFHWTSTVEGPIKGPPGFPTTKIIKDYPGFVNPEDVVKGTVKEPDDPFGGLGF